MSTDRFRETALRHARILEDQKRVKAQVADLILECYDFPSQQDASPSAPSPADAKVFNTALSLFQTTDFDELVSERNIDERCGYALCSNPNKKARHGGNKVWNQKGGKDFKLVDKAEFEKWCSKSCQARGEFVKGQLSSEPAWLRDVTETKVRLLDDMQEADDLVAAVRALSLDKFDKDDLDSKLKSLSLERGDGQGVGGRNSTDVIEREGPENVQAPVPDPFGNSENQASRKVRFDGD
jgi:RNA polymerase II-associated protein 2